MPDEGTMPDLYIEKAGKNLRCGFTTGSCAAAASKAALIMLLTNKEINNVSIRTPKGPVYTAEILDIERSEKSVSCAVVKDGGDDPDVTTGALIYSKVTLTGEAGITIDGGEGVGRVTKPGLDQKIGEAAINSVPRKMIRENLESTLEEYGLKDTGLSVIIRVPKGAELAQKTFNPKLGITGGISILGTTGIVEPMSDDAIIETIKVETRVRKAEGYPILLAAPGNYGLSFLEEKYGIDKSLPVMSSNFVYDTVRIVLDEGFEKLIFAGHIGKLVKVAGGIKNTHSKYGDHRMEILADISRKYMNLDKELSECVMTDEAVRIITQAGIADKVFPEMAGRIKENMEAWADNRIQVEVIVFSNKNTELVQTDNFKDLLNAFPFGNI
ncbi:cobalt-precorrin-5B (C(1))-methyltransferase CbiD [Butyrivibrio sp. INlla16]|uniref:cobalt-precorrin-5B (C(1))-methyltransferase CbiD n=1 Tax=Butyrivibrio sp. INlla16 TaxID=1520807 RepID=UPI001FA719DB|nr:cobalt-precorrin-5B (C(1))-methyltransferase CbiD [Butyrivibrio sp. INlla16]